jgi:hypothetical protein
VVQIQGEPVPHPCGSDRTVFPINLVMIWLNYSLWLFA